MFIYDLGDSGALLRVSLSNNKEISIISNLLRNIKDNQMIKTIQFIGISFLFGLPVAQAGTIIEVQDEGEQTSILTDGQQARINASASEYVIVNYKDQSVRVIDQQNRQVILFDNDAAAAGKKPKMNVSIKKLGSGQAVAGYQTEKFSYSANGKPCGVIYGSKDAYKLNGVKELLDAMNTMMEKQSAAMGGYAGMMDDCELADIELHKHITTTGIPLRIEVNGRVDMEVKQIKADVAIAADTFVIPASYEKVSMKQQMAAASKGMAEAQQQMQMQAKEYQPQMEQMVKELQQLEQQLTPEMMEQMQRAQEMMMQYQQQQQ